MANLSRRQEVTVPCRSATEPRGKKVFAFPRFGHQHLAALAFHPLKAILAAAAGDKVCFWDLEKNAERMDVLVDAPTNGVNSVAFSTDGKWVALGMENGQISIWDFASGRLSYSRREHTMSVVALCFSHDGLLLASGGYDNLVVTYDRQKGLVIRLPGHFDSVSGLAFAPDDKTLVSTSGDGSIRFWSLANHQVALKLAHGGGPINSVAFSPDGNLMATGGSDGTARLWRAAKLEEIDASHGARTTAR